MATCFSSGKTADLRLLQASRLSLPGTVTCFADSGYQGLRRLFAGADLPTRKPRHGQLTAEQKRSNKEQRRKRIGVEHAMRRLKVFKILSYRYRNRRARFCLRFNLIAALLNKDLPEHL